MTCSNCVRKNRCMDRSRGVPCMEFRPAESREEEYRQELIKKGVIRESKESETEDDPDQPSG